MKTCAGFVILTFALPACLALRQFVDMTHILENTTIRWPGHKPFSLLDYYRGTYGGALDWLAMNNIETGEHMGTHVDAPFHFWKQGWRIHEIPFSRLHGPAVVINIEARARTNRDAEVSTDDLLQWEKRNGRIPDGAYVLMNSGWDAYWGDQERAIGWNVTDLHYPGFSKESAEWLAENRPTISAFGSDTISCDYGPSQTFPAHVALQPLNIMCLENVANLRRLPESGAEVFAMPIKIRGTGAPIRMYAMWDDKVSTPETSSASQAKLWPIFIFVFFNVIFNYV